MYTNRDELLLLSRTGRFPHGDRGGPRAAEPRPGPQTSPPGQGGGHRGLLTRAASGCRRALLRGGRGVGAPGRVTPRGYAQREHYVELEFSVGFAAEDEPWL